MTAKQEVEQLVHKLLENCSLEDIQYHLYELDKVRRGLEDARKHGTSASKRRERVLDYGSPSRVVSASAGGFGIYRDLHCRRLSVLCESSRQEDCDPYAKPLRVFAIGTPSSRIRR